MDEATVAGREEEEANGDDLLEGMSCLSMDDDMSFA